MTIHNLVFDLDGTLIDSSAGIIEAVNYSLRKSNIPEQSAESISRFIGYPLDMMYPNFTDKPIEILKADFQVKAATTVVESSVILPEVETVLLQLKGSGYRMAIATTKIRIHIEKILSKFSWDEVFTVSVGGDDVVQVKPNPEAFSLALERLGAKKEESVVIGDTENDVLAAKAVPVPVIAVRSPYGGAELVQRAEPDKQINSIKELPTLLARMNNE